MAIYQYHLNSFHDVAKHYDSIKPIRGTEIRPLGDRARKWEHIVKVSRNKYILTNILPDDEPNWIYQENYKGMIDRAPITWTRNPRTGIETLRIRNGSGNFAHTSLYSFLYRALPYSMDFYVEGGKQFVKANNEHGVFQSHFLPKSTWVHETYYEHWKEAKSKNKYYFNPDDVYTKRDDKAYLEFEHTEWNCPVTGNKGTKFVLVHGQHKEPVTRYRIDKRAKRKYGQACKDLVEWAWTMRDLLVDSYQNDWQTRNRVRDDAGDCLTSNSEFCNMLLNEDDERRTPVVAWILGDMTSYDWHTQVTSVTDDPQKFRRQFNNKVNELAGFKTKHREFIAKDRS